MAYQNRSKITLEKFQDYLEDERRFYVVIQNKTLVRFELHQGSYGSDSKFILNPAHIDTLIHCLTEAKKMIVDEYKSYEPLP